MDTPSSGALAGADELLDPSPSDESDAANAAAAGEDSKVVDVRMLPNDAMGGLFEATVGATEEAIINALVAGRTMKGYRGSTVVGLPHDKVRDILKRHAMLAE